MKPFPEKHRYQAQNIKHKHKKLKYNLIIELTILILIICGLIYTFCFMKSYHPKINFHDCLPLNLHIKARSAIVVDAQTGQVVAQKNSHELVGIASQSKMLTSYETLNKIKNRQLHWQDQVKINRKTDWSNKDNQTYAHLNMHEGETISVRDLFNAMYTNSANDAALALADYIKPSQLTQNQALQLWANNLGLKKSKWYNAAGQMNSDAFAFKVKNQADDAENMATVEQLAILAMKNLQLDHHLRDFYNQDYLYYRTNRTQIHFKRTEASKLRTDVFPELQNPLRLQIEGLKSGSTPNSGGAFTGLIKDQDGHEFVTVVSGAGSYTSKLNRYQATIDVVNDVLRSKEQLHYNRKKKLKNYQDIGSRDNNTKPKINYIWVNKINKK